MTVENRLFDEIRIGDSAQLSRLCTENDLYVFARASGNLNPLNLPDLEARVDSDGNPARGAIAPAMWLGAVLSQLIGMVLPGPGSQARQLSFTLHQPVTVGDELTVRAVVVDKREPGLIVLESRLTKADGTLVADGTAEVYAPSRKIRLETIDAPTLMLNRHEQFDKLLAACRGAPPIETAIVCPEDAASLAGALEAADAGLITPVLIGDAGRIEAAAGAIGRSIGALKIVDRPEPATAAAFAVELALAGGVGAIMKGAIHTDALLAEVLARREARGVRRISHVFVLDLPGMAHPLFISDAAINIAPDLSAKVDITQNAIDLARACGLDMPRVGVLSAVETVNPAIPSTIDAAVIAKMAERGQIRGGVVDGPLAMDNAIDEGAARTKGIVSLVAGRAQVLIVPNLEAGNMLAKELTFIAHAEAAGLVLGARVPIMLTSRADSARARRVSCALAVLYEHWRRTGKARGTE